MYHWCKSYIRNILGSRSLLITFEAMAYLNGRGGGGASRGSRAAKLQTAPKLGGIVFKGKEIKWVFTCFIVNAFGKPSQSMEVEIISGNITTPAAARNDGRSEENCWLHSANWFFCVTKRTRRRRRCRGRGFEFFRVIRDFIEGWGRVGYELRCFQEKQVKKFLKIECFI